MKFILADYFTADLGSAVFDGCITDIPYKDSIKGRLNEKEFSFDAFFRKVHRETKPDAFLVSFSNEKCIFDFRLWARDTGWRFDAMITWDKPNSRRFISWSHPLHHTEYVLFFSKGKFKFNFMDGTIKPPVMRKSFGGAMIATSPNQKSFSLGMFDEIVHFPVPSKRGMHPAMKPVQFSSLFHDILCSVKRDRHTGEVLPPAPEPNVIDPFCGSGNLLRCFPDSIGVDIVDWITPGGEGATNQESFEASKEGKVTATLLDFTR